MHKIRKKIAVITLWRPVFNSVHQQLFDYLLKESFPSSLCFVWTVEKESPMSLVLHKMKNVFEMWGSDVVIIETEKPSIKNNNEKHHFVSTLYNRAITSIDAELVYSIEDDVVPPKGAFARLKKELRNAEVKVAFCPYQSRNCVKICAGDFVDGQYMDWGVWGVGKSQSRRATWVAAGCTLYRGDSLEVVTPAFSRAKGGLGWDIVVCKAISKRGGRAMVCMDIRAEHLYKK